MATKTVSPIVNLDEEMTPVAVKRHRSVDGKWKKDHIIADFKRNSKFAWVDFSLLRIDTKYQRRLQIQKITKMAHRWNPDKAGAPVVSKRADGFYYVIDGQHRYEALGLISNRPPKIFCEVHTNLTPEEEARLFHDLDNERDNLTRGASFKALLAAKDETALGITWAANKAGMTIDYDRGPVVGNVRAFKTVQDIYRRQGEEGLSRILRICNLSWPTSTHAAAEPIMRALEILISKYPDINDKRMIEVLSRHEPHSIINSGRQIQGTLSSAIYPSTAIVIRNLYNKRMGESRRLDTNEGLGF